MTSTECPPFRVAVAQLQEFIATQGLSPDLLWIFREDVVRLRRKTYIKVPVPTNASLAESLYNSGLTIVFGMGVKQLKWRTNRASPE